MASWISMLVGSDPASGDGAAPDPRDTIALLSNRLQHATLIDDRRAALKSLRGLARDYKPLVAQHAAAALLTSLHDNRHDLDMARDALEAIASILTINPGKPEETPVVTQVAEDMANDPSHVTILLDLLTEDDFHVRYDTLHLLALLYGAKPTKVIEGLLADPTGMARLMDLLDDTRDAIRTEAVSVLVALTTSNHDVQKIVAFQNAFDRIFALVFDEHVEPVTAQDALQLLYHLVRTNAANQTLFRETAGSVRNFLICLAQFLPPTDATSVSWTAMQVATCTLLLDITRALVVPGAASTRAMQAHLHAAGAMGTLLHMSLANAVPAGIQALALSALGEAMRGYEVAQGVFADSMITVHGASKSALLVLVGLAVAGVPPMGARGVDGAEEQRLALQDAEVRAAALYAVQCFLHDNDHGQLSLAMAIVNPPPDDSHDAVTDTPLANSVVLQPLLDWSVRDPLRTWMAGMLVCSAVADNLKAKEVMVGMYMQLMTRRRHGGGSTRRGSAAGSPAAVSRSDSDDDDDDDVVTLVQAIGHTLVLASRGKPSARMQVGLLAVLCCWTWEYPAGVVELLTDGTILQFLLERIGSSETDPHVQGLAAVLLSTLYVNHQPCPSGMQRDELYDVISARIGTDVVISLMKRARDENAVLDGLPMLDRVLVAHVADHLGALQRGIRMSPRDHEATRAAADATAQELAGLHAHVRDLEVRCADRDALASRVRELESAWAPRAQEYESTIAQLRAHTETLASQLASARANLDALQRDQDDLLMCLAEQDHDMKTMRDRLVALGDVEFVAGAVDSASAVDSEFDDGVPSSSERAASPPPPGAGIHGAPVGVMPTVYEAGSPRGGAGSPDVAALFDVGGRTSPAGFLTGLSPTTSRPRSMSPVPRGASPRATVSPASVPPPPLTLTAPAPAAPPAAPYVAPAPAAPAPAAPTPAQVQAPSGSPKSRSALTSFMTGIANALAPPPPPSAMNSRADRVNGHVSAPAPAPVPAVVPASLVPATLFGNGAVDEDEDDGLMTI
ncbi:Vesicle-mediated ER to Golgi transport protein [Allomyces arbusculus]|nr:Vesicle-mediated ER to Golgi transport protein [Allomyces arbusculus]